MHFTFCCNQSEKSQKRYGDNSGLAVLLGALLEKLLIAIRMFTQKYREYLRSLILYIPWNYIRGIIWRSQYLYLQY